MHTYEKYYRLRLATRMARLGVETPTAQMSADCWAMTAAFFASQLEFLLTVLPSSLFREDTPKALSIVNTRIKEVEDEHGTLVHQG